MNDTMSGTAGMIRVGLTMLAAVAFAACQEGPTGLDSAPASASGGFDEEALTLAAFSVDQMSVALVEAETEANRRRPDSERRPDADRVALVVEIGETSVELAGRILAEQGADPEQLRFLEAAERLQRKAEAALASGDTDRAVAFALDACWTALKAIVLPGGVTEEEARFIHDLALDLLQEAAASLGDPPSIDHTLLEWGAQFYSAGTQQLEAGQKRGVASLWKAAVLGAHILK